ncbi:hypothetical protein BLNAU_16380 [Blattamonas nauphoetae]|uniref:Uncharacterized protein n=1 Tax=Blattamonas nauphoetae TaxID=2049346 RepID=A0ABQ9X8F4_9EUKA|nr:hypothetical protein BLNAU_16380 [Blattamonas nauphoetae]
MLTIIHAGEDGFDGGKDLSEPLEIYYRGVVLLTDVNETGTLVPFTPPRTAPTFDKIEITATRGTSSETTLVTIAITGTNLYRCGSNTLTISPYFNGEVPVNPTWREVPITRATGMTEIVAEAKSSDLWPAGKLVVRVTIAAVNYVHYDVVGVGSESVVPTLKVCSNSTNIQINHVNVISSNNKVKSSVTFVSIYPDPPATDSLSSKLCTSRHGALSLGAHLFGRKMHLSEQVELTCGSLSKLFPSQCNADIDRILLLSDEDLSARELSLREAGSGQTTK